MKKFTCPKCHARLYEDKEDPSILHCCYCKTRWDRDVIEEIQYEN